MASLDDIQTSIQAAVQQLSDLTNAELKQTPAISSGTLTATKVIQTGFVRVLGVSVIVAGAAGALHDIAAVAGIAAGNKIYVVGATIGFFPVNLVFTTGLTYAVGAGQTVAIMYSRQ